MPPTLFSYVLALHLFPHRYSMYLLPSLTAKLVFRGASLRLRSFRLN